MDRREFIATGAAATAAFVAPGGPGTYSFADADISASNRFDPRRHRFGVNYTPSHNWWFCWNDWNPDPIKRDLDAIAALGADHLRILLIWPFFQPNPKWVSPAHLDRLDQLVTLMGERHLDALVTVFTGQLSGWYFLPSFNRLSNGFFTDRVMLDAQELFVRELGRTLASHQNVIGFDMGNEINTCWSAPTSDGDAWMARMFRLMDSALPGRLHVNGVDHQPWFANRHVLAKGARGRPEDAGDALLSLLDRRGEVWRRDGSAEREAAGGDGGFDPLICGHTAEAGVGGRIQHLHQGAERRAASEVAGKGGARGDRGQGGEWPSVTVGMKTSEM